MAVQFEGGVVIGADSRTTTGSYIVPFFTALSSAYFDDNSSLRPIASPINLHMFMTAFIVVAQVQLQTPRLWQTSSTIISRCLRPSPSFLLVFRLG